MSYQHFRLTITIITIYIYNIIREGASNEVYL